MAADGNRTVTEEAGVEKVTEQNLNKMNALQAAETTPPPPRPNLATQQSSSLPSTPYIHPRELAGPYRTPSPMNKHAEATSPRTARSESDGTLRPPGRTPFLSGCKYETGLAHSRRRIPYSIGADRLDSSPTKVKKHLETEEQEKLSGDMRELYHRILPSKESEDRRARFVTKLEKLLNERWPGNDIKVHVFGSSGNLLCTSDSDVDICITTPMKALERTCLLAKALGEYGMENVVCVPHAKVPIVKIWDPELKLACDMNVNNSAALNNTQMIRTYVQIDPRVRPLAMIVKYWTRRRILNDAALGGTLSSYTWICMIINYLQTRTPKILPSLQQQPYYDPASAAGSGSNGSFCNGLESLKGFGADNTESLGDLLFGFFRRYGHEINYEREVISVREGSLISKQAKKWHLPQNNRLGVEEPFNVERNLGNTADDTSFRGVHLELRRAFDLISQGKLEECCEQYEFPAYEEKFWAKPAPQPRPILTRSQSQSGRPLKAGSGSSKGSSSGQRHHRNGPSNRRASSAAAGMNNNKVPLYPAISNGDRSLSSNQIHDQLFHRYQLLQQQEQQLRLQMHQRQQATLHAQVTAQVQQQPLQVQTIPYAHQQQQQQQANSDNHRRHSNIDPPPLSAPLRSVQAYFYPVPMMNQSPIQSLSPSLPTSQSTTSPSSPSQAPAQPVPAELRRDTSRSNTTESSGGSLRSHSQPPANMRIHPRSARPVPASSFHPLPQGQIHGYSTLQQYQQAYLQQQTRRADTFQPTPESSETGSQPGSAFFDPSISEGSLREYMGYYVDQSNNNNAAMHRARDRHSLTPQSSSVSDFSHRARTVSPNLTRLRRQHSRSPSPSHSTVSAAHSINFYSSESPPFQQYSRGMMADGYTPSSGPVIVDGSSDISDYATPPESVFYPPAVNSGPASTNSDDRPIDTPTSGSVPTETQEGSDLFSLDGHHAERPPVAHNAGVLQFGELPARSTFRPPQPVKLEEDRTAEKTSAAVPSIRKETEAPNGLGIEVKPAFAQDHPLMSNNGAPSKAIHHSSTLSGLNLAVKPLATLSPVREVRTPSPTATRNQTALVESQKGKGTAAHGRSSSLTSGKEAGPSPLAESSSAYPGPHDANTSGIKREVAKIPELKPKVNLSLPNGVATKPVTKASPQRESQQQQTQSKATQAQNASSWQQSTSKKKKNKKSASVGSTVTIPLDPNERKGG